MCKSRLALMATEAPSHDGHSSASPPPAFTKRFSTSTSTTLGTNTRPAKKRATRACATCAARKVRCDVMQRYHVTADGEMTCSNCTMDGIKCVIGESKRRK
jgi:hypothetical protein